ncbi:MAG: hypothetical protein PT120_07515 [Aphanizomenon gracile PMC649.10]|nr:hypothetical protein [Aphanizomenon gracile PMC627.10]MDM3854748.1 hypothetical protein [Aphanizomenon gracile PMC649.10]
MESSTKIITWNEIESAAEQVFNLWVDSLSELKWAKDAWEILTTSGLITYSNEIERAEKLIYFLSLAGIYRDFWCLAADECWEIEYKEIADSLGIGIEAFNKQQLIEYIELIQEDTDIENNFYNSCFQELADENREIVYSSLLQGFGDVSEFFVSLWRSGQDNSVSTQTYYDDDEDEDEEDSSEENKEIYESDQDILNTATPEKLRAFEWITEGCYSCQ